MTKPLWGRPKDFPDTEPMSTLPRVPPGEEGLYAETEPLPLMPLAAPAPRALPDGLSLAPIEVTLYEVMGVARKDNRVCPQPSRWLEFYRVLQDAIGLGLGRALPAQPLVGSAWASTPPLAKRMAFHEQLEWADKNGCLQPAYDYLKSLREADWYAA